MNVLPAYMAKVIDGKGFYTFTPFLSTHLIEKREITECELIMRDGRHISSNQRKKIYATMRDISLFTGHEPEEIKAIMKYDFISKTGSQYFSLSDTDMTTANEFLEFLIEFCIEWDIPTMDNLITRAPDIYRYVYACLMHKKCCITRRKAELHHVDHVGAGRNRKEITNAGMRAMPLTRKLHTEVHTIGQKSFEEKYHVYGIKMDSELCKVWNVKG